MKTAVCGPHAEGAGIRRIIRPGLFMFVAALLGGSTAAAEFSQLNNLPQRIANRSYPSIFQAWNKATNLPSSTYQELFAGIAKHDLYWNGAEGLGLQWDTSAVGGYKSLATTFTTASLATGQFVRGDLLARNPNLVLIAEIRYRDALDGSLPANSSWWMRDGSGNRVFSFGESGSTYYRLDFTKADLRAHVAAQAQAALQSGVYDGVMLDWWDETEYASSRLALVQGVRSAIGNQALIIVNANDRKIPNTGQYVNGLFMEAYNSPTATAATWANYAETLKWAEANLMPNAPRVNCFETWYATSRNDLNRMRATTTLGLTMSDGYTLFSDPNPLPTPDHEHDWYSFYEADLGRPLAPGITQRDGTTRREFTRGTVVYNPMGNPTATIAFAQQRRSVATGTMATSQAVSGLDGDIFLLSNDATQALVTSATLRDYNQLAGASKTIALGSSGSATTTTSGSLLNAVDLYAFGATNAQFRLTEDPTAGVGGSGAIAFKALQAPSSGGTYGLLVKDIPIAASFDGLVTADDLARFTIDFDWLAPAGVSAWCVAVPLGSSSNTITLGQLAGSGSWQHFSLTLGGGTASTAFLNYVNANQRAFQLAFTGFSGLKTGSAVYLDNLALSQQRLTLFAVPEPAALPLIALAGGGWLARRLLMRRCGTPAR